MSVHKYKNTKRRTKCVDMDKKKKKSRKVQFRAKSSEFSLKANVFEEEGEKMFFGLFTSWISLKTMTDRQLIYVNWNVQNLHHFMTLQTRPIMLRFGPPATNWLRFLGARRPLQLAQLHGCTNPPFFH